MIKYLTFEEFKPLYKQQIKTDFPRMERRPLYSIKRLYGKHRYQCLGLIEDNQIIAYASFIMDEKINSVLLDYFAVCKTQRNSGVGSYFFRQLPNYLSNKAGIIMECEKVIATKKKEEQKVRERRIRFYQRNGAELTRLDWWAFGVDYSVLWLPIEQFYKETDIASDLSRLYGLSLPKQMAKILTRIK